MPVAASITNVGIQEDSLMINFPDQCYTSFYYCLMKSYAQKAIVRETPTNHPHNAYGYEYHKKRFFLGHLSHKINFTLQYGHKKWDGCFCHHINHMNDPELWYSAPFYSAGWASRTAHHKEKRAEIIRCHYRRHQWQSWKAHKKPPCWNIYIYIYIYIYTRLTPLCKPFF